MNSLSLITAIGLSAAFATPTLAQQIDVSSITCEQIASAPPETIALIVAFIDGYTGGQADDPVLDIERLGSDMDLAASICADDPSLLFMNVMSDGLGL